MQNLHLSTDTTHPLIRYRTHLEFNGFQIEEDEDVIFCRHPRKPNLVVRHIPGRGVLVGTMYSFAANLRRLDILEYVNDLNAAFVFMKAFVDEDSDLTLETFFEGEYDRTNFALLLDNVEYDLRLLVQNEMTAEYLE